MKIVVLKEYEPSEKRVPVIPPDAGKLVKMGGQVAIETGMGEACGYSDDEYISAGAMVEQDRDSLLSTADLVLRLRAPSVAETGLMKKGSVHVSFFNPFSERELLEEFVSRGIDAVSMEMIPRITRAQKMDALSSQAGLAGYIAVITAANRLNKIFPMMMTPAGTITPARVFVIGAGVAGLQAIATAKRLGARVHAFDTRPVVEEQVRSLGAKFLTIDLGGTGQTKEGYAKALSEEQIAKQRSAMAKQCADSDVVITTAQVFGKKAPLIVTREMVEEMKKGAVIVDLAAESGGNVEGTVSGKETVINGVTIIGLENAAGYAAVHASQMYSGNLLSFITEFWNTDSKTLDLRLDDEIIRGSLVSHGNEIFSEPLKKVV
ncbi:MAG: NAD(P) transhydrogenase subunit alpha [delta proteobacterium MLS_D]|jgi:H+-translocating NAD(P) transhydrogenase subunit alpha|nr:MAG: NAD(P) transhydrogenase subunit alpha [delta proteobacterium MLS_D]